MRRKRERRLQEVGRSGWSRPCERIACGCRELLRRRNHRTVLCQYLGLLLVGSDTTYLEIIGDIVVFVSGNPRDARGFCLVRWRGLAVALLLERVARRRCLVFCDGCHRCVKCRVGRVEVYVQNKRFSGYQVLMKGRGGEQATGTCTAGRSFQRHQSGVTFAWLSLTFISVFTPSAPLSTWYEYWEYPSLCNGLLEKR